MKKTKNIFLLAAALFFLTACGGTGSLPSPILQDTEPPISTTFVPASQTPSSADSDVLTEDDSVPPHENMVRSRLTNEWIDKSAASIRPIAVMTPNEIGAIPHYNLSQASVLYEAPVEGRMTRLMAVYEDWSSLSKIGNVRSLRSYYAYWAFEWDAFIVHYGGPFFINELLEEPDTQTIDGNLASDSAAFFRSADRSSPHNGYATGSGLEKVIAKKGYSLEYRGYTTENHFLFTTKAVPNSLSQYGTAARDASYIDMSGCYPLTRCYFEFNEEDGLYYRFQHLSGGTDGPHMDAATGTQLSFKNIIVQNTKSEDLGEGYLAIQCHDTTRDGWYFTNGKGIHVTWEKIGDYGATKYYDDDGNQIVMNTGKTMICIVREEDSFTFR